MRWLERARSGTVASSMIFGSIYGALHLGQRWTFAPYRSVPVVNFNISPHILHFSKIVTPFPFSCPHGLPLFELPSSSSLCREATTEEPLCPPQYSLKNRRTGEKSVETSRLVNVRWFQVWCESLEKKGLSRRLQIMWFVTFNYESFSTRPLHQCHR